MPTNVKIKRKTKHDTKLVDLIHWDTNNESDQDAYEFKENSRLFLDVHVEHGDRIYLEGLEQINLNTKNFYDKVSYDVMLNRWYIKKDCKIDFYDVKHSENSYVPGYYVISLYKAEEQKFFYAWIHVKPKFVDSDEYNDMVDDLERRVKGLSQTYVRGKHGIKIINDEDTDNRRIDILVKNFENFQEAMFRIKNNPRSEIGTEYRWSSKNDVGMDYRSTIKMSTNPRKNKRYLKRHVINFNTRGNIFLKHCLLEIRDIANDLYSKFHENISEKAQILKTYIALIDDLTMRSWLNEVSNSYLGNTQVGSTLMNYSYNFIMKLNSELHDIKTIRNAKKDNFAYYKKSSQQLYELWGFVQVIDGFERRGYRYKNGLETVLNKYKSLSKTIRDGFKDGTSIVLEKEEEYSNSIIPVTARIIYNEAIPKHKKKGIHLWTSGTHNKPDIRIDLFSKSNIYIGSSIVDTKYRRNVDFMQIESRSGSLEQLNGYSNDIRSEDEFNSNEYDATFINGLKANNAQSAECIRKVGAMYPGKYEDGYRKFKKNQLIMQIVEKPGEDYKNIDKFLNDSINEILKIYTMALKK